MQLVPLSGTRTPDEYLYSWLANPKSDFRGITVAELSVVKQRAAQLRPHKQIFEAQQQAESWMKLIHTVKNE